MNLNNIRKILQHGRILENEPMSKHTSLRIGGPARYYLTPATEKEAAGLIRYLHLNGIPYYVLGNGTNLLVSDRGYDGVIVDVGRNDGTRFVALGIDDGQDPILFEAGAGCLMRSIGKYAQQFGGSGFEALSGIPGCVGGACIMNAGAYGTEISDVIREVHAITKDGKLLVLQRDEITFGYRSSSLYDQGLLVTKAVFALKKDDKDAIAARMEEYAEKRRERQPLDIPSVGSTFKRPEGHFAGGLIEEAGLSGFAVGGAKVSEKHCGFLVNADHATASDFYHLIKAVQKAVYEKSSVMLEPEVRLLGKFEE